MRETINIAIREAAPADFDAMRALWNKSVQAGEVVYAPLEESEFSAKLVRPDAIMLVAEADGQLAGWIHGIAGPDADAPGYLTVIFVAETYRRQGVGTALLKALEERFRTLGKGMIASSGNNPVRLTWCVPGTPGHDHNNAPGVDEKCAGYPFLMACGLEPRFHEVAMYMNLAEYTWPEKMDEIRDKLLEEGIYVGRYDGKSDLEYDGMCDRVGSDYWRGVLREELAAWKRNEPNRDENLWVDGKPPKGPRPLLIAEHDGHIVGFTGPVDKQASGRGWFSGICVDPLFGKRSIGALLFNLLMQEFVDEGAVFSTLFTGAENHAQQIYLRTGFSIARPFAVMAKPLAEGAEYGQTHF